MKIRTRTPVGHFMWHVIAALLWALLICAAFTACSRANEQAAKDAVAKEIKTCADDPRVKACQDYVFTQCFGDTIVIEEDKCITKETAGALVECLKLCAPRADAGEADAAP